MKQEQFMNDAENLEARIEVCSEEKHVPKRTYVWEWTEAERFLAATCGICNTDYVIKRLSGGT